MDRRRTARPFEVRSWWGLAAVLALASLVAAQAGKESKGATAGKAVANKYIGADKCKNCHQAESSGNPFGVWKQERHSKAFEALASDKAKEIAKAKGIADPQASEQCLKCHTTAFGVAAELVNKGFDPKLGVQCETCHGPGGQHMRARMAAAEKAEGGEGFGEEKAPAYQTIPADEIIAKVDQKTCLACHNSESPTFKPFCFYERSAKLAHHDPRKPRAADAILVCGCGTCACEHGCEAGKCGVPKEKK